MAAMLQQQYVVQETEPRDWASVVRVRRKYKHGSQDFLRMFIS